jgi:hypothetical protein
MSRTPLALAAVLLLTLTATASPRQPSPQAAPVPVQQGGSYTASCTFTNPSFSGKCVENVTVPQGSTAGRACGEILSCLNSSQCTRTFCSATEIRGGWQLESATPNR